MRFVTLVAVIVSSLTGSISARDLFVSNVAGDDLFDGLLQQPTGGYTGPVRSIDRALHLAAKGDRVIIANTGVPYRESIALVGNKNAGNGSQPFVILGNGAVIDGSVKTPLAVWQAVATDEFRFRPKRMSYQRLFLADRPLDFVPRTAEGLVPLLEPLQWSMVDGYLYFRVEHGRLPRDYALSNARLRVGITLWHTHDVVIDNLIVQGFYLDGINSDDVVRRVTLSRITARGNGRSGIAIRGASEVELNACLIGDNGTAQVHCEAPAVVDIRHCHLVDNTAVKIENHGGEVFLNGVPQTDNARSE